ncbi:hypothetical protein KFL_000950080 [Klebsormidium nitens]|uniref:Uncharacterized protein n=1 Tax=Klebsormidium nitens TaxID=105231 RepID=A0A1Y1HUW0_KLENI|nr:hypothetical protein KFL_000950080 [Klebsormidium nitens]|eukprot:GAQ81933.1 hypothetical protein KFL_000950080 [Klebsormidium nitens]
MGAASPTSDEETLSIASLSIAETKPSVEETLISATDIIPAPENVSRIEQLEDEMERATTLYLDRSKAVHAAAAALRATMVELTRALEEEGTKLDKRRARVLRCAELLGVEEGSQDAQGSFNRGVVDGQEKLQKTTGTEEVPAIDKLGPEWTEAFAQKIVLELKVTV